MKKIETIWHHLLNQAIDQGQFQHTQAGLAAQFGFSTSTINLALDKPSAIGAVRKSGKFFVVADPLKLLYLAATTRNLAKDVFYHTTSNVSIKELEGLAPPTSIFAGYTAASIILKEPPADYSSLYLYDTHNNLDTIKSRYPKETAGSTQIFVLNRSSYLPTKNHTSLAHTFIDIWNMSDWYAHDFTQSLEEKIHGLLS